MKIKEPDCVAMKRKGAEYVAELIKGMSRSEELEFWAKRTEALRNKQKEPVKVG